jgi:hypothetical protein
LESVGVVEKENRGNKASPLGLLQFGGFKLNGEVGDRQDFKVRETALFLSLLNLAIRLGDHLPGKRGVNEV